MYQRENYQNAAEILAERKRAAEEAAQERLSEVHRKSARIREIDRELAGTGLQIFGAACAGEDILPLRRRNETLQKERGELLAGLGYREDYTAIHYTCPICQDTGYDKNAMMCSCLKEILQSEAARSSGLGRLIGTQTFENFSLDVCSDEETKKYMEKALRLVKKFAEEAIPVKNPKNLLLFGTTGTGKTHLSTAVAGVFLARGYGVLYDTAQNIADAFEADHFHSSYGAVEKQGEKYLACDLLILDDLGTEFSSSFSGSALYNLVNARMLRGMPTVISTNLTLEELQGRYTDRFYSRVVGPDFTTIHVIGEDRRTHC